jgi:hypothetical protein
VVVVVSDSLAQETSVSARIESAEERTTERGVFIDFNQWKFMILSRRWKMVVVSTPVSHENGPKK